MDEVSQNVLCLGPTEKNWGPTKKSKAYEVAAAKVLTHKHKFCFSCCKLHTDQITYGMDLNKTVNVLVFRPYSRVFPLFTSLPVLYHVLIQRE